MAKEEVLEFPGVVTELLPNAGMPLLRLIADLLDQFLEHADLVADQRGVGDVRHGQAGANGSRAAWSLLA